MRDEKLSTNFRRSEFACRGRDCCGGAAPVDTRLVMLLQKIRDAVDAPVHISSGFRCPRHNASPNVGGVPDSYHTLGHAADIFADGMSATQVYFVARAACTDIGYGHAILYVDRGIVHVDIHSRARD